MGLFERLTGRGQSMQPQEVYVHVKFRGFAQPIPPEGQGSSYLYRWTLPQVPAIGSRVLVPNMNGELSPAVVVNLGRRTDYGDEVLDVARLATDREIQAAHDEARRRQASLADDEQQWLELMARAAGLPSNNRQVRPPRTMPPIPPVVGLAPADQANVFGRTWWRAFKSARNPQEAQRFEEVARYWFKVRDEASSEQQALRLRGQHPQTLVRGRHFSEWAEDVKRLKREGQLETALEVLRECQEATVREDPAHPASWCFEQEAMIQRKLKRPGAERDALLRYLRQATEPSQKLVERLQKVLAAEAGESR